MKPLRFLVGVFVNTFGITQPTQQAEARAGRFIAIMLAAVAALLGTVALILHSVFTQ